MVVAFAGTLDRNIVVNATDRIGALIAHRQVQREWDRESRCEGMSVGGVARHLVQQPQRCVEVLTTEHAPLEAPLIGVIDYYRRASWASPEGDDTTNEAIRDAANGQAVTGWQAALDDLATARSRLIDVLPASGPIATLMWLPATLTTDDFLVTRLVEMVVHADDLATSVGLPTPAFGTDTIDPVLRLLTALSVSRHGEVALVRTLTRPQRASRDVTAF